MATQSFLSYVRQDDADTQGFIQRFQELLAAELSLRSGEAHRVWIDRSDIQVGETWQQELDQAILDSSVFIPIITPRYFASTACRGELLAFYQSATRLGLEELVVPIYLVTVDGLTTDSEDELVKLIASIQYDDWRELRLDSESFSEVRKRRAELAERILEVEREATAKPVPQNFGLQVAPRTRPNGSDDDDSSAPDESHEFFLDEMAAGEEALEGLSPIIEEIGTIVADIGAMFEQATQQLQSANSTKTFAARLRISRVLAKNIDGPTSHLERRVNEFLNELLPVDRMVSRFFEMEPSSDEAQEYEEVLENIRDMAVKSQAGVTSAYELATVVGEGRKWSKDLAHPLSRMHQSLRQMGDSRLIFERWHRSAVEALSKRGSS